MKLVQVNYVFDPRLPDPQALLDRYHTLTGWSDAVSAAGMSVSVVQAFRCDATVARGQVDYVFCRTATSHSARASNLHAAVRACEPDIVHVNGLDAPVLTWRLRRVLPSRVALVVQDHAGVRPRPHSPVAPLRRAVMRSADAYLFTTREQADPWLRSGFIGDAGQVHAVLEASTRLTPVDLDDARARTAMSGSPAMLWVGRLDGNKDPLTILNGFERALDALPNATLTMLFGDAPLLQQVSDRIGLSPRLRKRVRLVGSVPYGEMGTWYSAADLFVLGSHHEACGYALIEACACGAVPVVSGIAPFRAITGNGGIGEHWAPGDADGCARALVAAARRWTPSQRERVLQHFAASLSWDATGRRARAIYEEVCTVRQGKSPEGAC
jgi:glycosyltransferase involved in cell wall biosynthesis